VVVSATAASACIAIHIVITLIKVTSICQGGRQSQRDACRISHVSGSMQRIMWNANVDYASPLMMNGNRRSVMRVAQDGVGHGSTWNNLCHYCTLHWANLQSTLICQHPTSRPIASSLSKKLDTIQISLGLFEIPGQLHRKVARNKLNAHIFAERSTGIVDLACTEHILQISAKCLLKAAQHIRHSLVLKAQSRSTRDAGRRRLSLLTLR
jgi:hypothetical protein